MKTSKDDCQEENVRAARLAQTILDEFNGFVGSSVKQAGAEGCDEAEAAQAAATIAVGVILGAAISLLPSLPLQLADSAIQCARELEAVMGREMFAHARDRLGWIVGPNPPRVEISIEPAHAASDSEPHSVH